jgi:hypothetical protein
MQTRRDYLASLGLAKPGRGKFSNEAKAALEKAIANGMEFSDGTPAVKPVKPKATEDTDSAPKGVLPENAEVILSNEHRYYGKRWHAEVDGKRIEVSEKSACGNCRYSLIGHVCNDPMVISPKGYGFVSVVPSG